MKYIKQLSPHTNKLLKVALPIVMSAFLQMTYNLVDMLWVGHIGSDAVAAVGTAGFFINFGWALVAIVSVGAMVRIAHCYGAKDGSALTQYASTAIVASVIIGVLYALLLLGIPDMFIGLFRMQNQSVNQMAASYLSISSLSVLLMFLNLTLTAILNAMGKTRLAFFSLLYGNLFNIALNPLFIKGFGMGVDGSAWATVLAQSASLGYFIWVIVKKRYITFSFKDSSIGNLVQIVKLGYPIALQRMLFAIIAIIIGRIITSWGTEAIAAQKLGLQVESLTFMLVGGLSQAMAIVVGHSYGAGKYANIQKYYNSGLKIVGILSTITTLLFVCLSRELIGLFVTDYQTIEIGASYLVIVGLSQFFMCQEMMAAGTYSGQGLTKYPAAVSITFTAIRIPLALYLGFGTSLGINGVWWSISITTMFKGVILALLYRRRKKRLELMIIEQKAK